MKSDKIKQAIVDHVKQNPIQLPGAITRTEEIGREQTPAGWKRLFKRRRNTIWLREFECIVGWNFLQAEVRTNYPEDDEIIEIKVQHRTW